MSNSAFKETWKVLITNEGIASRSGALGGGLAVQCYLPYSTRYLILQGLQLRAFYYC